MLKLVGIGGLHLGPWCHWETWRHCVPLLGNAAPLQRHPRFSRAPIGFCCRKGCWEKDSDFSGLSWHRTAMRWDASQTFLWVSELALFFCFWCLSMNVFPPCVTSVMFPFIVLCFVIGFVRNKAFSFVLPVLFSLFSLTWILSHRLHCFLSVSPNELFVNC